MLRRRVALACLAALAVACEDDLCKQAGCVFGDAWIFVVDEATESGALRPGGYAFTVEAGDFRVEWACTIAPDDPESSACDNSVVEYAEVDGGVVDHKLYFDAWNRGSDLAINLDELIVDDFVTYTVPESFVLEVRRDGALAARGEYAPAIEGRWINGEGCSPYCAGPTETVELRIPAP